MLSATFDSCLGLPRPAQAADGLFDAPIKLVRLPLPADPANPQAKAQLSCFYFPRFMIKEVDLGELGAEQLSVIPVAQGAKRPVCKRENIDGEIVIPGDEWSGYFWGVKGGYVFFSAEDGWNGGMGFAVFDMNGKKLFEDAAKTWHSIQAVGPGATLRYQRVYEAPCSLKGEDGTGCWQQIQKDTGLASASAPDCAATYAGRAASHANPGAAGAERSHRLRLRGHGRPRPARPYDQTRRQQDFGLPSGGVIRRNSGGSDRVL